MATHTDFRRSLLALPLMVATIAAAGMPGQRRADVSIEIRVVDTANKPLAGADVSLIRGVNQVAANGVTDETGRRRLSVPRSTDALDVVVRKIGYTRADRFVIPSADGIVVTVALHEAPHALPTVNVTAAEDLKRKRYHIDADDIAASTRPIIN